MGGRDRDAPGRDEEQRGGGGRLGRHPARRLQLRDPRAQRVDDPPSSRSVPRAMADWAESTTQIGTPDVGATLWVAISRARMMPIVFWASFPPWPRL